MEICSKKILVLSSHTDDAEIAMGGTISKLIRRKCEVVHIAFSFVSDRHGDLLRNEFMKANQILGIPTENLTTYDYPTRRFPEKRQEILDDLIKIKERFNPDIVFCPSPYDVHQDHSALANEVKRAFKHTTILGYVLDNNQYKAPNPLFITINLSDYLTKLKAIKAYESQKHRPYSSTGIVRSVLTVNGLQCGRNMAEKFEPVRIVI